MIATIALSAVLAVLGPLADASDAANGSAASAAQAPENPAITRRVDAQFDAWQRGSLDRSLYALRANEQLGADVVGAISAHLKPLGTLHSANSLFKYKESGSTIYVYSLRCENGSIRMRLGFDPQGRISTVSFEPDP